MDPREKRKEMKILGGGNDVLALVKTGGRTVMVYHDRKRKMRWDPRNRLQKFRDAIIGAIARTQLGWW